MLIGLAAGDRIGGPIRMALLSFSLDSYVKGMRKDTPCNNSYEEIEIK